jgi:hypothetical protein
MGIQVEFNPDLALRKFGTQNRKTEECIPEKLEKEKTYKFLKEGQRNYWLFGQIPLLITEGNQKLSRPIAAITILEATHFIQDGKIFTRGNYKVNDIFDIASSKINFEGFERR